MGSAALAAAIAFCLFATQVKRPEFPTRDNEALKKKKKKSALETVLSELSAQIYV